MAGTRFRQGLYSANFVNNTRRKQLGMRLDKGGLVYSASTITASASTDTIDDSGTALPVFTSGVPIEAIGLNNDSRVWKVGASSTTSSVDLLPAIAVEDSTSGEVILRSV